MGERAGKVRNYCEERVMSLEAKYAVKFVGYSAYVIARKHGREIQYATLDFVSGAADG
jgi:hypothetical protein